MAAGTEGDVQSHDAALCTEERCSDRKVEPAGGDEGSLADAIDAAATALLSGPDAVLIPHRGENQPLQEPERCGSPFLFDRVKKLLAGAAASALPISSIQHTCQIGGISG